MATSSGRARLALLGVATLAAILPGGPTELAAGGGRLPGKPRPDAAVLQAFDDLLHQIKMTPRAELGYGLKLSFYLKAASARHSYRHGHVCPAANTLEAFVNHAEALRQRKKRAAAAESLYASGRAVRTLVVAQAAPQSACADVSVGRPPEVALLLSDNERFRVRVRFGAPVLSAVKDGDEHWTQLALPGIDSVGGPPGQPSVPSWQALVAVPRGAEPRLQVVEALVRERIAVNLYPFQRQAADQASDREAFLDPPFVKDEKAYETPGLVPADTCAVRLLGQARDLQIAQVQCSAARYDAVSDALELIESVELEVHFEGGKGTFVTSQSEGAFEPASRALAARVLNEAAVRTFVEEVDLGHLPCRGEELLILTHPSLRAAADALASWKSAKGIATSVRSVGAGTGYATGDAIDALIESRYDECQVRPSYVLLLGDSGLVPPSREDWDSTMPETCETCGDPTTGSDWGYAIHPQFLFDVFPDFGVGRIPVATADQALRVVGKIVQYESNPPFFGSTGGGPFYTTTTNASYFQCCRLDVPEAGRDMRSFVETSELVRGALVGRGYSVERIYFTSTDYARGLVADRTPRRYFDGTPLPAALAPGSFIWNGHGRVKQAFEDGRFLILHRDHGTSTSWSDPPFDITSIVQLRNGSRLPVVYSVNCASGNWDESPGPASFMEQLLVLSNGGMVGGLGDNRNSPTWINSALTRGFYDATWPEVAPGFGGGSKQRRLGDILTHGKLYILSQIGVAQPAGDVGLQGVLAQWIMWHAFGDPTLEMWTENPHRVPLSLEFKASVLPDRLRVEYGIDGAELTALQLVNGEALPIGRAVVEKGVAELVYVAKPDAKAPMLLSASLENAVSVTLVRGGPPI